MDHNGRRAQLALFAALLVGLALRLAYLAMNAGGPDFDSPVLDPQLNDYWARALVTGDWTPPPHADDPEIRSAPYGRPPGYPYLLGAVYWLCNGSYLAPRIAQLWAGLANIVLVYLLARRLFNAKTGVLASFLLATYWAAIYFEGELNSPVWEVFLALSTICLLLRWADRGGWWALCLAGAALGAGALLRPNVLLVGLFVAAWIFYVALKHRSANSRALAGFALFPAVCVLTITPALVRNYVVAGEFVLISYYGGINAYIGNNPDADGVSPTVPDLYEISGVDKWNCFTYPRVVRGMGKKLGAREFGYADASRYFWGRALEFWRDAPAQAVKLTLRKAWFFWGPHEISDSKVIHYERAASPLLSRLPGFPLVLAAALVGMILFLLRRNQGANTAVALTLVYMAGYFCSIIPFFIAGRYRFPVVPLLLPFSGYGLAQLMDCLRRKKFRAVVTLMAAGVIFHVAVSLPVVPYTPNLSTWHTHRGIAYAAKGHSQSVAEFEKAIAADPANDEALLQLGYLLARQGRRDDALFLYRAATEANPRNVYAQNNLGYELFLRGHYDKAEECYRRALARHPEYTLAWNNLGNALLEQGRADEALEAFENALEINPQDPHARYNMGNVFLRKEAYDEAVAQYQAAFEANPGNPDIANNMGFALLQKGESRQAVPWFEKALDLAPDHFLAHFNLGDAYAELELHDEAQKHFARCLELQPDHEEARKRIRK